MPKIPPKQLEELYVRLATMPDGTPAPSVLTKKDLIRFLRLDEMGIRNPEKTVLTLRAAGLPCARISRSYVYPLRGVIQFMETMCDRS